MFSSPLSLAKEEQKQAPISFQVQNELPDIVIGIETASATVVEYTSLTCDHCADFHKNVLPKIKEKYIDTGQVRLIFRHFPIDNIALHASLLVTCLPKEKRYETLSRIFAKQGEWLTPKVDQKKLAQIAGYKEKEAKTCYEKRAVLEAIMKQRLQAQNVYKVWATPTFFINGRLYEGALSFEEFEEALKVPVTPPSSSPKPNK